MLYLQKLLNLSSIYLSFLSTKNSKFSHHLFFPKNRFPLDSDPNLMNAYYSSYVYYSTIQYNTYSIESPVQIISGKVEMGLVLLELVSG